MPDGRRVAVDRRSGAREQVTRQVLYPAVEVLSRMGCPFQGVLYAGLMIVKGTPYVLEFNARMGDPETQVVLPLLKTDLLDVMEAVVEHRLDQLTLAVRFTDCRSRLMRRLWCFMQVRHEQVPRW